MQYVYILFIYIYISIFFYIFSIKLVSNNPQKI